MSTIKALTEIKENIINNIELLDEEKVLILSQHALDNGMDPATLLVLINEGMKRVGKLYERREYYIADLIMSGLIFKEVMKLNKMRNHFHIKINKTLGKVVLGTVKGDIHDIGKDIFRGMLETNGFTVIDLGVDVPKEVFLQKSMEIMPDIVGLSGVLTHTVEAMKDIADFFMEKGVRNKVKIIIGGYYLDAAACDYVGADTYANDASVGITKCMELVK